MKMKKTLIISVILLFLIIPFAHADLENGARVEALNETVDIEISESGSKNFYGIDNIVGAKNKIINDEENKDYYEIKDYELDDGTTVELIYPNGKQNNADKKEAIVNGTKTTQPRVYGRDGITHIKINYNSYIHSEETVNYVNNVTGRTTTVTNNLGRGDSWSQDGATFDNQVANDLEVNTTEGTYRFNHWIDDAGNVVHDFFIEWENGAQRTYNFFAVYDFTPWPAPEPTPAPVDNETNETITPIVDNETSDNGTDIDNKTSMEDYNDNKATNNESTTEKNDNPLVNSVNTNNNKNNNTTIIPLLNTGNNIIFLLIALILLIGVFASRRRNKL